MQSSLQLLSRYSSRHLLYYTSIRHHIPVDHAPVKEDDRSRPGFKERSAGEPEPDLDAQRLESRNLRNSDMYLPGGPFQFTVRTAASIRRQDQTKMFPHYECLKDRVTLIPSFTTKNLDQSRAEVLHFYRKVLRCLPQILMDYNAWQVPVKQGRRRVAEEFRKNSHIRDSRVIDKLRIKGEQELQNYKVMRYHLSTFYKFVTPHEQNNPVPNIVRQRQKFADSDFLAGFYSGDAES